MLPAFIPVLVTPLLTETRSDFQFEYKNIKEGKKFTLVTSLNLTRGEIEPILDQIELNMGKLRKIRKT